MNVEDILNFDPVAEAEKANLDAFGMLGLAAVSSAIKTQAMESIGDTHSSMTMQQFLTCAIMHGFKIVYQEEVIHRQEWDKVDQHDMFYVLWDGTKLIVCDSWRGRLNSGNCHFAWRPKTDKSRPIGPCSNGLGNETTFGVRFDVREGLFYWLEKNAQAGEFVLPHVECMEPRLNTFADSSDNQSYHVRTPQLEAKSKARAAKLPKEVFDNLVGRHIR